ncbi:MAG: DUF3592 domain-containing protein [Cyanobacteria bacterium J06554_6]
MLKIIFLLLVCTIIALTLLLLGIKRFSRKKRQLELLAQQGRFTTGVVFRTSCRTLGKQRQYQLHYAFRATNGRRYRSVIAVAPYIWHCYEAGSPIEIAFMAQNPDINSAKYLVSEIRKMMYTPEERYAPEEARLSS